MDWRRGLLCLGLTVSLWGTACLFAPTGGDIDGPSNAEPFLASGPHAVGFRSLWAFDEGRTYRTAYDDGRTYGAEKAPRPVLVLLWYPARSGQGDAGVMAHEGYFAIESAEPPLSAYSKALKAHARGVLVEEVYGKPEVELDDEERGDLDLLLASPTPCRRDAEPAEGPFPLVVTHSGAGSSFEDNAGLCAFLASHGYVVLASAYPEADGSSLGIDGGRGSAEDAQFLVRQARALPFVDWRHVAYLGHSAGAQAMLRAAAAAGCAADALVLLDTTQDYYGLELPVYERLVREVGEGRERLTLPMLVAAGPEAFFSLCDTLVESERTYLTVPGLGHDEYLSQGLQRLDSLARRAAAGATGIDAGERTRAPAVHEAYRELCETVRAFLDAELGKDGTELAERLARDRARPWSPTEPRLVRMPRGASGPEAYDPGSELPPTPRQFVRLMREEGAERGCALLERFRDAEPRGPLYTSTMLAGSLLYGLDRAGRPDEAARYYAELKDLHLPVLSLFTFLADMSVLQQKPEQGLHFLRFALGLDPQDADVARKLRELGATPESAR